MFGVQFGREIAEPLVLGGVVWFGERCLTGHTDTSYHRSMGYPAQAM
jgi:hypothetical protein